MFDGTWYAEDAVSGAIREPLPTTDSDAAIQWTDVDTVPAHEVSPAHGERFDSELYAIDTTVARPIKQQYEYGDDTVTFVKPARELMQASWGLDNVPITVDHPNQRHVVADTDVHGFLRDPNYDRVDDSLTATMYIPTSDGIAQSAIADSRDVSVGFYSDVVRTDREGVDGEQVSILFDHVALVEEGRCSSEDGCQVHV